MLFSVSMFPLGAEDTISHPVAEVIEEIDRAGLAYRVTAMDTVIEGNWDEVMAVIRQAQKRLIDQYERVYLTLVIDEHKGARGRLAGAVDDIERELGHAVLT